jgi:hypothetical protein
VLAVQYLGEDFNVSRDVTVTVTPQNAQPVLSPASMYYVRELAANNTVVGVIPFSDRDNTTQNFTFACTPSSLLWVSFNRSTLQLSLVTRGETQQ